MAGFGAGDTGPIVPPGLGKTSPEVAFHKLKSRPSMTPSRLASPIWKVTPDVLPTFAFHISRSSPLTVPSRLKSPAKGCTVCHVMLAPTVNGFPRKLVMPQPVAASVSW